MAQLSDDCFAHGGALMPLDEALTLIAKRVAPIAEIEEIALVLAPDRVLAEDVASPLDVPAHDNSAVDGYAVFFDDLSPTDETRLPITARVAAGHPLNRPARRGEAVRIFTGGRMPEGPDTVMMQEDCRLEGDNVVVRPGIKRGANRRRAGEDVRRGELVLHRGQRLRAQDIGEAAAVGRTALKVYRPLKVALFSTGDELAEPGKPLAPGQIYDSNRYTLSVLLSGLGCLVNDLGILGDRREIVEAALAKAAGAHDVIMTSGGVSTGEEDHVKQVVETLGRIHFWRLAVKPGRPIALGQIGNSTFVGLPGNPVAVMVTFLNLARPLLLRLMGAEACQPRRFKVRAGFSYRKKRDRREWLRVRLEAEGGGWKAIKFPRDGAGILSSMVAADGLLELPEAMTELGIGDEADFLPFSEVLI